jgi:SecD/SecF fusion protein
MSQHLQAAIIFGSVLLAFLLGLFLAKRLRMASYGWRLGTIFASLALGISLCSLQAPKWGIDLRGGVILIYEVDEEETAEAVVAQTSGEELRVVGADLDTSVDMGTLIQALTRRINPSGVREIVIRPYGRKQVEIIIPEVSSAEIDLIKLAIKNTGYLKFRIVAERTRNQQTWDAGELALASKDEAVRKAKTVRNAEGKPVGEWILLDRMEGEPGPGGELPPFRVDPAGALTRELVPGEVEVLTVLDDVFNVEGKHLRSVSADFDENGQPCVEFQMTAEGAGLFGGLTGSNLPDRQANSYARLGIVMDEKLLSAPQIMSTITSHGEITGRFTQAEVDFLVRVLRAGRLPAVLQPEPISQYQISPLLGEDTIRKGRTAIIISMVAVVLFMIAYYRFAGFVACLALAMNLVLTVALMILIRAAFTLPGLAGLALTVGMSVDANVLIFERIREELQRGATLRMAIRNGFDRANRTIVDSNVTTLITTVILYAIGTDQIKGFAITMILGILMCMYTAVFCSRVVFDIAERKQWIKRLRMNQFFGETHFGFMGMQRITNVAAIIYILVGIGAVVLRGPKLLDIDFTGGSSVQCVLKQPLPIEQVRTELAGIAEDVWITQINPEGRAKDTVYKIDTSVGDEKELQRRVQSSLTDPATGETLLEVRQMSFTAPVSLAAGPPPATPPSATAPDATPTPQAEPVDAQSASSGQSPAPESKPPDAAENALDPADVGQTTPTGGDQPQAVPQTYLARSELTFAEKINAGTLKELIELAAEKLNLPVPRVELSNPDWDGRSDHGFTQWSVNFTAEPEQVQDILDQVHETLSTTPVWLSANEIGASVAGHMRTKAIVAIVLGNVAVIGYLWIRFQSVTYGLAAVLALVHDVTVTVGAIALSYWLAKVGGFLLIDEFKVNLTIVAAVLTIMGYSLNDTIVVFDRIREVKGKNPHLTGDTIDVSTNQTLSRTILTFLTVFIVVVILYCMGGEAIHGFAFALLVGCVFGVYSSVFIAAPALLWMSGVSAKKTVRTRALTTAAR